MQLVLLLQPAQDADRVLYSRLVDIYGLETPLERRVLLDIFLVFIERRRADHMQLAARECRLQQVRGVHRTFARTSADQRVHFIDEQDDLAVGVLHLVDHGLQPLLELAAIFRTGDQRAHVERHQRAALQAVRHIAIGDAQGQALGNRRLAGARLADQHGVVLGPARQDLDRAADLLITPDHRVQLAVARRLRQVAGIFLERVIALLRARAVRRTPPGHFLDHCFEPLGIDTRRLQGLARIGIA